MTQLEKQKAPGALVPFDYGEDAGKGYENQTKADLAIPFINLLQSGSPLVKNGGARAGDFLDTVTQRVYPRETGLLFAGGTTKQMFAKWMPRDSGGGFRGHLQVDDRAVQEAIKNASKFGKYVVIEKDDKGKDVELTLSETFYIYGALSDEDHNAESMAVIPFWSTKIKPYRGWTSRLRSFNQQHGNRIPLYANLTRLTSREIKNAKGDFYIPVLSPADPRGLLESLLGPDNSVFQMAKTCAELIMSGDAEVNYDKSREAEGEDDVDDGLPKGPDGKPLF